MKVYKIETTQIVNTTIDQCWDFFSTPENLKKITPPHMGFEILGDPPLKMYAGQLIHYNVKPVLGIKMKWLTEITQVKKNEYFIDEQRMGPYKLWHHQHLFKETTKGVEMKDIVHYVLPFGIIGMILHHFYIKQQLAKIFSYRRKIIELYYPKV